jgi:hypothetical protein
MIDFPRIIDCDFAIARNEATNEEPRRWAGVRVLGLALFSVVAAEYPQQL